MSGKVYRITNTREPERPHVVWSTTGGTPLFDLIWTWFEGNPFFEDGEDVDMLEGWLIRAATFPTMRGCAYAWDSAQDIAAYLKLEVKEIVP